MDFNQERQLIETRFATQWDERTPVDYANVAFTPPALTDPLPYWARLTVRSGEGSQITLGENPEHRYVGLIYVQLFGPKNRGTKALRDYATIVAGIFTRYVEEGLICRTSYLQEIGETEGWYQINVVTPYIWNTL